MHTPNSCVRCEIRYWLYAAVAQRVVELLKMGCDLARADRGRQEVAEPNAHAVQYHSMVSGLTFRRYLRSRRDCSRRVSRFVAMKPVGSFWTSPRGFLSINPLRISEFLKGGAPSMIRTCSRDAEGVVRLDPEAWWAKPPYEVRECAQDDRPMLADAEGVARLDPDAWWAKPPYEVR
jgi:hypothetical protein